MRTAAEATATPPLPPRPLPCRAPGLGEALGFLVLYFGLQLLLATLIGGLVYLASRLRGDSVAGLSVQDQVRHAMASPDLRTAFTAATLVAAAGLTLWLARRRWPLQWKQPAAACGFGFRRPSHPAFYAAAILLGLAIPVLGGMLTHWLAHGHAVPQDVARMGQSASLAGRLVLAGAAVTMGPLVEETLFRGVLLSALLGFRHHGTVTAGRTVAAVLISAALFGLVHLPDLGYLWYAVPNLILLGIATAWLRLRSGSLWPAVLAHAINNLLAVAGWFLATHPPA